MSEKRRCSNLKVLITDSTLQIIIVFFQFSFLVANGLPIQQNDEIPASRYDDDLTEGDMIIPESFDFEEETHGSRKRRAAYDHTFLRWESSTIPYEFDPISNVCKYS